MESLQAREALLERGDGRYVTGRAQVASAPPHSRSPGRPMPMILRPLVLGLLLALVAACSPPALLRGGSSGGDAQDEIAAMEREWMEAVQHQDSVALDRIIADDFVGSRTFAWEQQVTKESYLRSVLGSGYALRSFEFTRMDVRAYGSSATAHIVYTQNARARNQNLSGRFAMLDVWRKNRGRWQVVERHAYKLP